MLRAEGSRSRKGLSGGAGAWPETAPDSTEAGRERVLKEECSGRIISPSCLVLRRVRMSSRWEESHTLLFYGIIGSERNNTFYACTKKSNLVLFVPKFSMFM